MTGWSDNDLSRDERFRLQTTEQFAALGRFVQAFEGMVSAFRSSIIFVFGGGLHNQQLLNILLHHRAMTAQPLFEVMRAHYAVKLDQLGDSADPAERAVVDAAMSYLSRECNDLFSIRNNLLHGSWYIGWASQDQEDFSKILAYKHKVGGSGLSTASMPASSADLDALTARCVAAEALVVRINGGFLLGQRVRFNIRKDGDAWVAEPPQ